MRCAVKNFLWFVIFLLVGCGDPKPAANDLSPRTDPGREVIVWKDVPSTNATFFSSNHRVLYNNRMSLEPTSAERSGPVAVMTSFKFGTEERLRDQINFSRQIIFSNEKKVNDVAEMVKRPYELFCGIGVKPEDGYPGIGGYESTEEDSVYRLDAGVSQMMEAGIEAGKTFDGLKNRKVHFQRWKLKPTYNAAVLYCAYYLDEAGTLPKVDLFTNAAIKQAVGDHLTIQFSETMRVPN